MMLFLLVLGLFLLSTFKASEMPKFYFLEAPNEIKTAIGTPDLSNKLNKMNLDSEFFEISKRVIEPEIIELYVRAQIDIASSLYRNEAFINFKSSEMKLFASFLLKSFQEHSELFDDSKLLDVFTIFIASGTSEKGTEIRSALSQNAKRLKPIPRLKLLQQFIKYASGDIVFISPGMLDEGFVSPKSIENFFNDYIYAVINAIEPKKHSNSLALFAILFMCIAKTDQVLSFRSYELLLNATKEAVDSHQFVWHGTILAALNQTFYKFFRQKPLVEFVIDIIFRILVLRDYNENYFDSNMVSLMTKCTRADSPYFKSALEMAPISYSKTIEVYLKQLRATNLAINCFELLRSLTTFSNSSQYRLALSAAKNLRNVYKQSPEIIGLVPVSGAYTILRMITDYQLKLLRDIDHQYNTISSKIVIYLALIDFEKSKEDQKIIAAEKIAYGLGQLLLHSSRTPEDGYPTEFVEEVMPLLDEIIKNLCLVGKTLTKPMTAVDLGAYIKVIRLHTSNDVVNAAINRLCFTLITSMPIEAMGYLYVKDIDFIDEAVVTVAGFMYFVQQYLNNPRRDEVIKFKDYFNHLVSKNFLNKTQELAIRCIFRDFE